MQIAVISYGSRGDVQPSAALARALTQEGHQAQLLAPLNFAGLAEAHGIAFAATGDDLEAHLAARIKALPQSGNVIRSLWSLRNELQSLLDDVARDTWAGAQGADLVIGSGPASASVAERLRVPFVEAALQPFCPTRAFPTPVAPPQLRLGGAYNRLTHHAFEAIFWQLFRGNVNRARTHVLGLPPYPLAGPLGRLRTRGLLRLYGYSAHVVPRPADWPDFHHVTGYWQLPAPDGWQPPAELQAFLDAGPPPVAIGFGSMLAREPRKLSALVLEAVRQSGQRAVLIGGWGALEVPAGAAEQVCFVREAPHAWLYPRVAAIVHHGGAGTTGAAIASGAPSLAVPFGFDQPFWGQRIAELGVGPRPIARAALSASRLAAAIRQMVSDEPMRERARLLGERVRAEPGLERAAALIQQIAA